MMLKKGFIKCLVLIVFAISGISGLAKAKGLADSVTITLNHVKYPYPVNTFDLNIDGEAVKMAYMDVMPTVKANNKVVILFHGKNFGGYYWTNVIKDLTAKGFRVIIPNQVGFGKSSKAYIHYSFHRLALNNKLLLEKVGISGKVIVLGHSMGGMLATRFALMYPEKTEKLVLEDPIGLEDYRTFVPYITIEEQYKSELGATAESIKNYYLNSYFTAWKPEYDELVNIAASVKESKDFPRYAKVAALTYEMIYEQPVVYEFANLKVPVLLIVGTSDRTIVGKGRLSTEQQQKHGQYQILGGLIAKEIPGCKLVEIEQCGHIPHLEKPAFFMKMLFQFIGG